jgi:hypothetical protein
VRIPGVPDTNIRTERLPNKSTGSYRYCNLLVRALVKKKLSLQQAMKAHRVVRRRGSHIFLDNRLTDGGEVVSPTRRPPFTPSKIPGTHFCRPQGHSAAGWIRSIEKSNDLIGNRIRDLPACSVVPQPTPPTCSCVH